MPPKKGKITIKKEEKIVNNKSKDKKLLKIEESSIKSTDDDSIDDDEYETEDMTETSVSDNEESSVEITENQEDDAVSQEETEETEEESDEESVEESVEETVEEQEDECLYRKAKVKNLDDDGGDEAELEEIYDDDNVKYDEIVKSEDRITKPFMTIFERVRLLGDRAKQLSLGAKPMIKGLETMNPKEIARLELEKGVIPLIIERSLPNGRKERWHVKELQIIN